MSDITSHKAALVAAYFHHRVPEVRVYDSTVDQMNKICIETQVGRRVVRWCYPHWWAVDRILLDYYQELLDAYIAEWRPN